MVNIAMTARSALPKKYNIFEFLYFLGYDFIKALRTRQAIAMLPQQNGLISYISLTNPHWPF